MVSKICCWDGGVCRLASCDIILPSGEVTVCEFHGNVSGYLSPRKVKPSVLRGVFDRSVSRRGGGY